GSGTGPWAILEALSFTTAHRSPGGGSLRLHGSVRGAARSSVDDLEPLGNPAQVLAAPLTDHDQVLDPDAELSGQVDPRLDRHHLAFRQRVLRAWGNPRALVDLEA